MGGSNWRTARPAAPRPALDLLQLPLGPLAGWPWERGFAEALVHWASALQGIPCSSQVLYAELALDFESHNNQALQARPGHRHTRQVLSLRERARVLQEAVDLLQPLLAGGTLLEGDFRWMCASLGSMGRTEQQMFACQSDMQQHMQQLQVALPGALDAPAVDPGGRLQGLFPGGVFSAPPGRGGRSAPV